jgi:peptidyl-prolyl cis-trans isomerase C
VSISVNNTTIDVEPGESGELAAARELLRQRAIVVGLLVAEVQDDAAVNEAIEALLAREVITPSPTEEECRRYYESHLPEFRGGDLVHARHILFQVTPSVRVPELRARAEQMLNDLLREPDRFDAVARELSNCPSGQHGGNLGQIGRGDTVPEFEKALFRFGASGILHDLVKTRYGFHIVAIDQSIPGNTVPFEAVQQQIAERLKVAVEAHAMRQYVSILAGQAEIVGVSLQGTESPLVQ